PCAALGRRRARRRRRHGPLDPRRAVPDRRGGGRRPVRARDRPLCAGPHLAPGAYGARRDRAGSVRRADRVRRAHERGRPHGCRSVSAMNALAWWAVAATVGGAAASGAWLAARRRSRDLARRLAAAARDLEHLQAAFARFAPPEVVDGI